MQDIEMGQAALLKEAVDTELPIADKRLNELSFIFIAFEVDATDLQIQFLRLNQDGRCVWPSTFEPHRIVAPVCAQLDHRWAFRNDLHQLLKNVFLQRFMNATVNDQDVAE